MKTDDTLKQRPPIQGVHVDRTHATAATLVHRHLPAKDADRLLAKRFQIINLWRPIYHAAYDLPLALCDCRTVDVQKDFVPTALKCLWEYSIAARPVLTRDYVQTLTVKERPSGSSTILHTLGSMYVE